MKTHYIVPVTMEEVYRLRFVEESAVGDYFKKMLTSPRPDHSAPAILFERDSAFPDELFGIAYDEDKNLMHYFYFSTDELVLPHLKKNKSFHAPHIKLDMPGYEAFKLQNSRFKHLFGTTPVATSDALPVLPAPQRQQRTDDHVLAAVFLVFFSLLSRLISIRSARIKNKILDDTKDALLRFVGGIQQQKKRNKVERLIRSMPSVPVRRFLELLDDPPTAAKISTFLNTAAHDPRVVAEMDALLASVRDASARRVLKRIVRETIQRSSPPPLPQQTQQKRHPVVALPPPPPPTPPTTGTLYQFIRSNRQSITTPSGAVSPVFVRQLSSFLENSGTTNPAPVVRRLTGIASRIARNDPSATHRKITDALLHATTTTGQGQSTNVRTISPVRKPRRRPFLPATQQATRQEQGSSSPAKEKEATELVRRVAGRRQSGLGADIVDANIQNILHSSKAYAKALTTLQQVIRSRRVQRVFVVDAPNLLATAQRHYARRQEVARSEKFLDRLCEFLGATGNDMVVVVSQMNRTEWVRGDPVYFGRIGPDEKNGFLLRVGCVDGSTGKDCYTSPNTNFHNECDDFVRLDLMSRLLHRHHHDEPPTFFHATNDKGHNWRIQSDTIRQAIQPIPLKDWRF